MKSDVEGAKRAIKDAVHQLCPDDLLVCGRLAKENGLTELATSLFLIIFGRRPLFARNLAELCGSIILHPAVVDPTERMQIIEACRMVAASSEPYQPLLFQFARVLGSDGDIEGAAKLGARAIALAPLDLNCQAHQIHWLRALHRNEEAEGLSRRYEESRTSAYVQANRP